MDIGDPHNYLLGTQFFLQHIQEVHQSELQGNAVSVPPYKIFDGDTSVSCTLSDGPNIIGNVLIHPSAQVDPSAVIGPDVVIGKDCKVGAGSRISNSTILS